jgi:hypothetical protein
MTDDPGEDLVPERTAAIREATAAIQELRGSIDSLATKKDLLEDRRSRKRVNRLFALAVVVIVLLLGGIGYIALQAREQANFNGTAATQAKDAAKTLKVTVHQIRKTNDILIECTTPSTKNDVHECQESALASQRAYIGELTAAILASNACSSGREDVTIEELRACVRALVPDDSLAGGP